MRRELWTDLGDCLEILTCSTKSQKDMGSNMYVFVVFDSLLASSNRRRLVGDVIERKPPSYVPPIFLSFLIPSSN